MTQHKRPTTPIPVRVRFRSPGEQEHAHANGQTNGNNHSAYVADTQLATDARQMQQRTRQIKELIRLGNMLRADLSLDEVLQHIVAAISSCTGFHIAVIKLVEADGEHMVAVAFAGVVEENERQLRVLHDPVQQLARIMRPEFRLSQSYFVSHEHIGELADIPLFTQTSESDYEPGGWH